MRLIWTELKINALKIVRRLFSKRERLAARYLHGSGIEIGALAHPLAVPRGVIVKYLDKVDRAEVLRMNPELDPTRVVTPDLIDDGFTLSSIGAGTQDFIIANHILEHTPDPVGALVAWTRVLRPGGVLYVCVPIASRSFDAGRAPTPVAHMLEDYQLYLRQSWAELDTRNRNHLSEWITISEPNILSKNNPAYTPLTPEQVQTRVRETDISHSNELHYHTFSFPTFQELISLFTRSINPSCQSGCIPG